MAHLSSERRAVESWVAGVWVIKWRARAKADTKSVDLRPGPL